METTRFELNKEFQTNDYPKVLKEIQSLIPDLEKVYLTTPLLSRLSYLYWLAGKNIQANIFLDIARSHDPENPILKENKLIIQKYLTTAAELVRDRSAIGRIYEMTNLSRGRVLCFGDPAHFVSVIPFFEQAVFVDDNINRIHDAHNRITEWFDDRICILGNAAPPPFKENSFDTIIITGGTSIHNFLRILEELKRICNPEGRILIDIDQLSFIPDAFTPKSTVEDLVQKIFPDNLKFIEIINKDPDTPPPDLHLLLWIENNKPKVQNSKYYQYSPPPVLKSDRLVSVIIPTYNRAYLLPRAINSILSQSYQAIEVIVVDDGSTDNTEEVVKQYDERVKYIKLPHTGMSSICNAVSVSSNAGIRQASGQYIAFLADDDMLLPRSIEVRARYLINHPEFDLVCANSIMLDPKSRNLIKFDIMPLAFESSPLKFMMIDVGNFFFVHSQLIRREVFSKVGLFTESSLVADMEYNFKIARYCKIGLLPIFASIMFPGGGAGLNSTEKLVCTMRSVLMETYHNTTLEEIFPEIKGLSHSTPQYIKALLQRGVRMVQGGAFTEALQDLKQAVEIARTTSPELASFVMISIESLVKSLNLNLNGFEEEYFCFLIKLKEILQCA